MKNLGKLLIISIAYTNAIFASVVAEVIPDIVYMGDTARYTLTLSGEDIKKPMLLDICGNPVTATGSQTSITMVNGDYKKSYTLSFNFVPQKSCTIEAIGIEIDSKIEYSNTVSVVVKPVVQDVNADFVLTLKSSKTDVYVGEPFDVSFELKQKRGAEVVDSKFIASGFKGFWVKQESPATTINDGAYIVTRVSYRLSAQRDGNNTITPSQIKIASRRNSRDNWGTFMPQVQWRSYYSNALHIHTKALPKGVKLIGNFTISAEVEKNEIHSNEAVNLTLTVKGKGNLEDIESFKPFIKNVNIFDEKIQIKKNTLHQKLAFISDENFTITPFSLQYFDITTQKIKTITTQAIKISVIKNQEVKKLQIIREVKHAQLEESKKPLQNIWLLMIFLAGVVVGIIIMILKGFKTSKKEHKINFNDEKLLLIKLLPFKDIDAKVQELVISLEQNIYSDAKISINKKELKHLCKLHGIT